MAFKLSGVPALERLQHQADLVFRIGGRHAYAHGNVCILYGLSRAEHEAVSGRDICVSHAFRHGGSRRAAGADPNRERDLMLRQKSAADVLQLLFPVFRADDVGQRQDRHHVCVGTDTAEALRKILFAQRQQITPGAVDFLHALLLTYSPIAINAQKQSLIMVAIFAGNAAFSQLCIHFFGGSKKAVDPTVNQQFIRCVSRHFLPLFSLLRVFILAWKDAKSKSTHAFFGGELQHLAALPGFQIAHIRCDQPEAQRRHPDALFAVIAGAHLGITDHKLFAQSIGQAGFLVVSRHQAAQPGAPGSTKARTASPRSIS